MSEAQRLRLMEERARELAEISQRLTEEPRPALEPAILVLVEELGRQAVDTAATASSPVKIGVVGEFNAGKTLLLGALMGYADGLPVSEIPTTGNITALNFTPCDELATTQIGPFVIEYLDHRGVEECLAYLLQTAQAQTAIAGLRADLQQQLAAFQASDPATLPALERWCNDAWVAGSNPNLRYLLRELVGFIRTYARCGAGVCSRARPWSIDAERARQGLRLDEPPRDIQGLAFSELPPAPRALAAPPEFLGVDEIRATFPLIRRVTVEIRLSRHVWDLSRLAAGNRFVLLDFPGLGAANSGVRDLYLCLRELAEVQTILVLLNGDRPGGAEGAKLYDLMQKNRPGEDIRDTVLVGVGRFDRLPLGNEGVESLRKLLGTTSTAGGGVFQDEDEEPPARVTEEAALQALPILKTCIAGAEALTPQRKDRIVLLSPLLHLKLLGDRQSSIQVGSPTFLGHMQQDVLGAMERRKLWKALTERLEQTSPGVKGRAGLTRWLDDFAEDGGVSRLRDLIASHVQTHGLSQLHDAATRKFEALRGTQKKLREKLPAGAERESRTSEDQRDAARKKFGRLSEFYQMLARKVKLGPGLDIERDGRSVPLAELLQEEVVFRVSEWDQWDTLLQASRDGLITEAGGSGSLWKDDDESDGESVGFPTTSEDFYPSFETTLQELEEFTRRLIAEGVDHWLGRLAEQVTAERQDLQTALQNTELTKQLRTLRLGQRGQGLVPALRAALDPTRMKALLLPEGEPPGPSRSAAAERFPLARATRGNPKLGRTFAWARKLQEAPAESRPPRNFAHQCQVFRLRDEFVSSLSRETAQVLSEALRQIQARVETVLADLTTKLAMVSGNDRVLDVLIADPSAAPPSGDDPLATVRQLVAVNLQS